MYLLNNIDFKEECKMYMAVQGLPYDGQINADRKIHRYSADFKKNKRDEWYVAYEGLTTSGFYYLYCIFGSWSEGSRYEYKSFEQQNVLTEDEKQELKKIINNRALEAEQKIKEAYEKTAQIAQRLWAESSENPPMEEFLRYTKLKGISPLGEVRFGNNSQGYPSIIIPLKNVAGVLRSLQYISVDEQGKSYKRFLSEGEKRGNFHIIGTVKSHQEILFVAEGYATAVSVHEATSIPVIISFDAGNLEKVIENIRDKFPQAKIIIAGDNDERGIKEATKAANKFACKTIFPYFSKENEKERGKDFNDLHQISGIHEVKKQLLPIISNNGLMFAENYLIGKEEPCENFKLSSLPVPLREYIASICKTTKAHPIMVTSSVLTMVSGFIGTKVFIAEGEYFQTLYPNLWILCIAKSGQFKTTALNKGAKISFDKQSEVFKSIKEIQNSAPGERSEKQILSKSLENVVLPTKQTAEGFLEYLSQGHQGAIFASEFGGWLQNLDKTHNNDFKAILTEFYDVPSYYRYKTKTQGDCIIETPYISICGVSTMPWIRANLKPNDVPSGFFARFLIFVPPYQEGIPPAFPMPTEHLHMSEEEKFKGFLNELLESIGASHAFSFTKEARELIEEFHNRYIYLIPEKYSEKAKEILEPYLKRWSPYLIKLSMIMQLFIDRDTDQIGTAAVISAMSILIPAIKSTALLFEGELGESAHQRKCRIVLEFIVKRMKETGKPVKRHAIIASKKLEGGVKEYDDIFSTLIAQGKISYSESPKKNESEYFLVEEIEKN